MPYKPKLYIVSTLTSSDAGTLVQATVTVPFPSMNVNSYGYGKLQMLHLKHLQVEVAEHVEHLDTEADHFILTITPNTAASHPVITDNDCLFKHAVSVVHDGTAANSRVVHLIKSWKLKDVYINKPQFYIQVSIDAGAAVLYFKFEYEVINVGQGSASYEQSRRGYTSA